MREEAAIDDRVYRRFVINVKVFDKNTGECLGYSSNMHTRGMMLMSMEEIPVGLAYEVKLSHLREDDSLVEIDITARCMWCKPGNNPDFFNAGFQFVNPGPKQIHAIDKLISDMAGL